MVNECDKCGDLIYDPFIRCDDCMRATNKKTCPHTEVVSHWLYVGETLKGSGFCSHCGIDFYLPSGSRTLQPRDQ